jgi:DNA-directed RNA polymerase subunit RPC12/RpoP
MNEKAGTVLYICPLCGKQNRIKYNEKLICNDCIYVDK